MKRPQASALLKTHRPCLLCDNASTPQAMCQEGRLLYLQYLASVAEEHGYLPEEFPVYRDALLQESA